MRNRVIYLTGTQVRQLARDAARCAGAVKIYAPLNVKRAQQSADRVLKLLAWRDVKLRSS